MIRPLRALPRALACALGISALACASAAEPLRHPDHYEFDAALNAAFRADASGMHRLAARFDYPAAGATHAAWRIEVLAADGRRVRSWIGMRALAHGRGRVDVQWDGRDRDGVRMPDGYYGVQLTAVPAVLADAERRDALSTRVQRSFALGADETIEQRYDIVLGDVSAAAMPAFAGLPRASAAKSVAATAGLPYTVYYGNLHSQTNHSDGGTAVGDCGGSEVPQGGTLGPADAYAMMRTQAGGDFLLTSEHNHMYDGSTGTNANADPSAAKALFASGLQAAAAYRAQHPGFVALYGMEWGVISNGGHLNIVNPDALAAWESNGSGQLIGDVSTPKSDYPALYATMKARGWIGQFNHPATSGQFLVNGTALGFDANGAEVMVAAEILNSSAFSTSTDMTEDGRSTYTGAWNKLLEAGYRVAPTTNQDNHCANWGLSFTNRTGVLMANGSSGIAGFVDALRARRTFATEDRTAQLVLTANGRVMGEQFANSGPLTLVANYAGSSGQSVQRVQFFEGVPKRNGTVTQLAEGSGTHTFTPGSGEHFYYAVVTQANGLRLWSAPVWVNQGAASTDTVAPTVSASAAGSSGTIALNASASDNVGVTLVEFFVDGNAAGSDASAPYSVPFNAASEPAGNHVLTARARDAAGNSTTSAPHTFVVSGSSGGTGVMNETESNGTIATADGVPTTMPRITGTMGNTTDKDYFRVNLGANASLKVDMTGPAGSSYDYDLYIVNGSDGVLKQSTGSTTAESVSYTNGATAQTVYVKVISYKGSSTTLPYTLTLTWGGLPAQEMLANGGFESGATGWTATSGVITSDSGQAARTGTWKAWLNGYGTASTDTLWQAVSVPTDTPGSLTLRFWLKVASAETSTTQGSDTLKVQVRGPAGNVLRTLATYSNLDKGAGYVQRTFDLTAYKGQPIRVYFEGVENGSAATSFVIDDASVQLAP